MYWLKMFKEAEINALTNYIIQSLDGQTTYVVGTSVTGVL